MIILIVAAALTIPLGAAQRDNRAEAQLQAAITKETVEGDLKGAIEQYKKLASGSNRAVAARALVRMGECYEKLGDAEARKVYERVVREFPDQKEALAEAQQHLATKAVQADVGIVMQRIAVFPDRRSYTSMSHDGRCLTFIKADGIYVHDLAKSEERRIVPKASQEDSVLIANIFPDGRERERDF
jgi:tetratricopeptide (TPR) repeat protein